MPAQHDNVDAKIWLVKSAGRILGPYSANELVHHLESQSISVIDEVEAPCGRWRYLREVKEFFDIIQRLRLQHDSQKEDTMTSTLTSQTFTQTDAGADTLQMKDVTSTSRQASVVSTVTKTYGSQQDRRIQKKLDSRSRWIWTLTLVICMVVGAGLIYQRQQRGMVGKASFEEYFDAGLKAKSIGLYQKSLELFKKAQSMKPQDPELLYQMAPISINLESQTVYARRQIDAILIQQNQYMPEAYNLIGLTYLKENDLKNADENFQKALSLNPQSIYATVDRAVTRFKSQDYAGADNLFRQAQDMGFRDGLATLGRAISRIELSRVSSPDMGQISDIQNELARYMSQSTDYHQESLLLNAALSIQAKKTEEAENSILQFLTSGFDSTDNHVHDLMVDRSLLDWGLLVNYCEQIHKNLEHFNYGSLFYGFCLIKANREGDAKKYLNEALSQYPKDPIVQLVQAHVARLFGKDDEARASLKIALENPNLIPALLMRSDFCELDKDMACVQQSLQAVLDKNQKSVEAISGLAWLNYRAGRMDQMNSWMQKGFSISNNYQPLLELREKIRVGE